MAKPAWLLALENTPGALPDYVSDLQRQVDQATRDVLDAVGKDDLTGAKAALAQRNLLAAHLRKLVHYAREEIQYRDFVKEHA